MLRRLQSGVHDDVAVHNGLLYTTTRGTQSLQPYALHVYSTKTWQQTSVIDTCSGLDHFHTLCVNEQCMFIACWDTHRIHKMSLDGILIDTYGKDDNGIGEFNVPLACMSDCDNLLVADLDNNRLQLLHGRQWSVLQLRPSPSCPRNALYDGNALYVVQWEPSDFVKYE